MTFTSHNELDKVKNCPVKYLMSVVYLNTKKYTAVELLKVLKMELSIRSVTSFLFDLVAMALKVLVQSIAVLVFSFFTPLCHHTRVTRPCRRPRPGAQIHNLVNFCSIWTFYASKGTRLRR